ncbi:unnamed protein product [Phytomonas sp. EM1]|nr:unnamed protein product [Phytomonas sp. EM1]|eukprot:CCW59902.1 unnamed protein product [Phytomonas sp. isolate EM1]
MGCNASKTKNRAVEEHLNDKANTFLSLVNVQKSPVARELLQAWTHFVDVQNRKIAGGKNAESPGATAPAEVWATTENNPLTHHSVDQVGKAFLEYIKNDLSQRGWGGNFDYKVVGVATQGFLRASANIDTGHPERPEEVSWAVKIHYHSSGPG